MINFDKLAAPFVKEKPKYGKVIALTAISVAAIEGAAILGAYIAKKIHDSKIEKHIEDEGFELIVQAEDVSVEFETEENAEE